MEIEIEVAPPSASRRSSRQRSYSEQSGGSPARASLQDIPRGSTDNLAKQAMIRSMENLHGDRGSQGNLSKTGVKGSRENLKNAKRLSRDNLKNAKGLSQDNLKNVKAQSRDDLKNTRTPSRERLRPLSTSRDEFGSPTQSSEGQDRSSGGGVKKQLKKTRITGSSENLSKGQHRASRERLTSSQSSLAQQAAAADSPTKSRTSIV